MAEQGYKSLISYKLAQIAFDLGWDFVPQYYSKYEDGRQRDQIKQALRSYKQNIVEGSSERSLSSKLKLYDVAKASSMEALEDFEDILRKENLPHWDKDDPRLKKLHSIFENYPCSNPSNPPIPPFPSTLAVREVLGGLEGKEGLEAIANYLIDLITRGGYLLDKQINSVEEKHQREGGYNENLLKKRLAFKNSLRSFLILLFPLLLLIPLLFSSPALATNSGNFTMSVWVSPTTSVASKTLISKAEEFRVFTDASGYVGCQIKTTTWQTAAQATTKALVVGTWANVICTYDLVNLKVYVNGVLVATQALTSLPDDTANLLKIGQDDSASSPYTNISGTIDEFKFYAYALTASEVLTEYNHGSSLVLGSSGSNSSYPSNSSNQKYCVPGDTTSCAAPIGEWNFEEGTDNTCAGGTNDVCDTSGSGNDGAWNGTGTKHWDAGKVGKGGKFNGSDDYVNAPNVNLGLNGTSQVSTGGWYYINSISTDQRLIQKQISDGWNSFALMIQNDGKIQWTPQNSSLGQYPTWVTSNAITTGWHHIFGTFKKSASDSSDGAIYIDGKLVATTFTTAGYTSSFTIQESSNNLVIGARPVTINNFFNGKMDQVMIFNYARSAAQVAYDYNKGAPVGYWDFDECQGTVANDRSGNSNNGTITIGTGAGTGHQDSAGTCTASADTAWYNGRTGKRNASLNFDGIDDYVTIANNTAFHPTDQVTVSVWINPSASPATYYGIAGAHTNDSYELFVNGGNVIWDIYNTVGRNLWNSGVSVSNSTWTHIAATYNSSTGLMQVFKNGILSASHTHTSGTGSIQSSTSSFLVGWSGNSTEYFQGSIDEVKIFNYALTGTQIKDIYNNGAVHFGP